jgi:ATP-dependent DNA helicase RecG
MTSHKLSNDSKTRLETMTATNDGFEIAEVDLKLRGPGDIMGTQQSGVLNLKIADIVKDNQILKSARYHAMKILKEDANLSLHKNKVLRFTYAQLAKHKNIWNYIS